MVAQSVSFDIFAVLLAEDGSFRPQLVAPWSFYTQTPQGTEVANKRGAPEVFREILEFGKPVTQADPLNASRAIARYKAYIH